jgi:hypothetical protein
MSEQQQAAKLLTPGGQQGSRLGSELVSVRSAHSQQPVAKVQVEPLLGCHPADHCQTAHQALLEGPLEGSWVSTPVQQLCGGIMEVGRVL